MEREKFGSRLGFILISAGCAIGIGNVWRFPYVAGYYGGGFFVLFYLLFLVILGIPVLSMELAIGRAGRASIAKAYNNLEKPGQKWHIHGVVGLIGNYLLLFFYTTVAGWMLGYFLKYISGSMNKVSDSGKLFSQVLENPSQMIVWMLIVVVLSVLVCSLGLKNGVERITKWMMLILLGLILVLAIHSFTLDKAGEGIAYFLIPNIERVKETGFWSMVIAAMNQSFFTLSLGIGAMLIFGSYIEKDRSLLSESIQITILDTFVAVMSGFIIFPACFSFDIPTDSGPSLIFITLPKVFENMAGGQIWGTLFFLFMTFAALSTVIAVLENILACNMELFNISRMRASIINFIVLAVGSLPCLLGFNVLSKVQLLGEGSTILDFEDFLVSNISLPFGSLVIILFCVSKFGWGFKNYLAECNTGAGIKMSGKLKIYLTWILPLIVLFIAFYGLFKF